MTPETRYARTSDGTHVAYQVAGDGPLDILTLRAWHSNLDHEWAEPVIAGMFRRLETMGRVIRLDRRGTGLSDRIDPDHLPTVEHRVDDIRAVLDAAGSERVVIIGLAHGAALSTFFAASYPDRTAGLVLWSPPPDIVTESDDAEIHAAAEHVRNTWGTTASAREIVARAGPSRSTDEDFIEWIRLDQLRSSSADEAAAQWVLVSNTNIDGILPSIHVPTLVLWRAGAPGAGPHVGSRIPEAVSLELPGRDHILISGDWRPPLVAMERFIDGVRDLEPEYDRILATIMFTDLADSTRHAVRLGDASWSELVERHHRTIRREISRHRGREIDTAGDGFFAAFDSPMRAIRAAAAIRAALGTLNLTVRIGLHTGECERAGTGLRGVAVHVGARIGAIAAGGEILASSTVRDLVAGSGVTFDDLGSHALKGIPERVRVYRVASV